MKNGIPALIDLSAGIFFGPMKGNNHAVLLAYRGFLMNCYGSFWGALP